MLIQNAKKIGGGLRIKLMLIRKMLSCSRSGVKYELLLVPNHNFPDIL